MSDEKRIEIEQIEKAGTRLNTLGIHKSPEKVRGIGKCKSVKRKRMYSRNIVIKMDVNSPEFKEKMRLLKEKSKNRDIVFS